MARGRRFAGPPDEGRRLRFVGLGAYSLDLEIFAYVNTQDYREFLAVREDICGAAPATGSRTPT